MNIKQAISNIESRELAVHLNIASDLKTFLKLAQQEEAVIWLGKQLDVYENRLEILARIYELSRYKIDLRYENQWDTALAVFLWLLNNRDPIIARIGADVASQISQCWWATKLSRFILLQKQFYSDTRNEIISEATSQQFSVDFRHDMAEVRIFANLLLSIDNVYRHKYDFIIKIKNPQDFISNESWGRRTRYIVSQLSTKANISEEASQL